MMLNHAKSRDGEPKDTQLVFHRRFQEFKPADPWTMTAKGPSASPAARVKGVWESTGDKRPANRHTHNGLS
jgi:hypothetical protein